jgi:hypothetical protein
MPPTLSCIQSTYNNEIRSMSACYEAPTYVILSIPSKVYTFTQHLFRNTLDLCYSLELLAVVSQPYSPTGKFN